MVPSFEQLKGIDRGRLGGYLAGQVEFREAFPLFFRVVGDEVCARLAREFPGIAAHVGEDYRSEAIERWHVPRPPLDWVAFSFPGYPMWDFHVGVVARLDVAPATAQTGVHWTPRVAADIEPLVGGLDWRTAVGDAGERAESPAAGEIQQRDLARPLDPMDLAGEAARFAERAIRYYAVVRPLVDARARR